MVVGLAGEPPFSGAASTRPILFVACQMTLGEKRQRPSDLGGRLIAAEDIMEQVSAGQPVRAASCHVRECATDSECSVLF